MKIMIPMILGVVLLMGCSNPIEQLNTTDGRPSLLLKNVPSRADIFIDGTYIGKGRDYNAKAILVENGTHVIQVVSDGNTVLSKKIFVSGSATKTLIKLAKNDRKNIKTTQFNKSIGAADVDLVKNEG